MADQQNNGNKLKDDAVGSLWKPKKWSVMVYLAGGRDISDEARESLLRMKQVGSTENIHLVAQFDSGSEGTVTKRYYLTKSENSSQVMMLLEQACAEVPDSFESEDDGTWMYYYKRISKALSERQRVLLETMPQEEMKKLLISSPERFKNFVLDCMLSEDVYPRLSGKLGDTNAGKPEVLVDFIRWAKVRYPAEHYLVVLWGH